MRWITIELHFRRDIKITTGWNSSTIWPFNLSVKRSIKLQYRCSRERAIVPVNGLTGTSQWQNPHLLVPRPISLQQISTWTRMLERQIWNCPNHFNLYCASFENNEHRIHLKQPGQTSAKIYLWVSSFYYLQNSVTRWTCSKTVSCKWNLSTRIPSAAHTFSVASLLEMYNR